MQNRSPVEKKIVDTALEMFNKSGVEYVGMREIATTLDMRIGNLTYYFPTKDDLVNRLTLDLAEENSKTIVPVTDMTIEAFFEMLRQVFLNHLKYRCLMLSFVHIIERNPIVAKRYAKVQTNRNETWAKNIRALKERKFISVSATEVDFLVSSIALIARFWISEAVISQRNYREDEQMQHYLKMIARIFLPYATTKGKRYLSSRLDE
jgi:AcrR family transcriptional regulator